MQKNEASTHLVAVAYLASHIMGKSDRASKSIDADFDSLKYSYQILHQNAHNYACMSLPILNDLK